MALPLRDDVVTREVPWVTIALIAVNVVVFLFVQPSAFQNPPREHTSVQHEYERQQEGEVFAYRYGVIPCEITSGHIRAERAAGCPRHSTDPLPSHKVIWLALLTAMFLHGSVLHLAGNMLFLWLFGNNAEDRLGPGLFLGLYLVGGAIASLGYVFLHQRSGVPLLGASGAIAVAMGAYLVFHPRGRVLVLMLLGTYQLVYVPAMVVLVLFFVTQFFTPDAEVAWEAHAVGMAFGFLAALVLQLLPPVRRRAELHRQAEGARGWDAF